jgi:hypothetical protein
LGTTQALATQHNPAVPTALAFLNTIYPTLKRWGIISRTYSAGFHEEFGMKREPPKFVCGTKTARPCWLDFFKLMKKIEVPGDFLLHRQDSPPQERNLF